MRGSVRRHSRSAQSAAKRAGDRDSVETRVVVIDRAGAVPYAEGKFCPTCSATFSDSVAFCAHDGTALRSREGLEPGTVIRKKYQIISELGRGGMAVVYRVRHLIWNEDKALKIMLNTGEGGLADQGVS